MRVDLFDYHLPPDRIAQTPAKPRDHSRLLRMNRKSGITSHHRFDELPRLLNPGDVLVFNDSKVIRARLFGHKETGGKVEIFLLRQQAPTIWEILVGGRGVRPGHVVHFSSRLHGTLLRSDGRVWQIKFHCSPVRLKLWIERNGKVPLPPYIKTTGRATDYQTIYAQKEGSVAAPTAGLHFTHRLLRQLHRVHIQMEYVTLHVGLGTFAPVTASDTRQHLMHPEWASIDAPTARRLNRAKAEGRRIIAVGTTSVRTLEAFSEKKGHLASGTGDINLFITPGNRFKMVDGMITNFHLPKSTLLMLVSAFGGRENILNAYAEAIAEHYRFYSFGDAMLIA